MRVNDKQQQTIAKQLTEGINFHRFTEAERESNPMEIAQEFGISLGEVKELKKKISRT